MNSRNKLKHLYLHFFRTLGIYLTVIALTGISLAIIYFNQVNQSRKTTQSSAQEIKPQLKLLTYNIHGSFTDDQDGKSKEWIVQELKSLAVFSNQPTNTPSPTRIPTTPRFTPTSIPTVAPTVTKTPTTAFTPIPTKTGIPTNTPSPLPPSVCSQLLGDLSCDGVVDALDVGCWAYQFRNRITKPACADGDLNNDKKIDILDFSILKTRVGK